MKKSAREPCRLWIKRLICWTMTLLLLGIADSPWWGTAYHTHISRGLVRTEQKDRTELRMLITPFVCWCLGVSMYFPDSACFLSFLSPVCCNEEKENQNPVKSPSQAKLILSLSRRLSCKPDPRFLHRSAEQWGNAINLWPDGMVWNAKQEWQHLTSERQEHL